MTPVELLWDMATTRVMAILFLFIMCFRQIPGVVQPSIRALVVGMRNR